MLMEQKKYPKNIHWILTAGFRQSYFQLFQYMVYSYYKLEIADDI